jgi:hypothetical protein
MVLVSRIIMQHIKQCLTRFNTLSYEKEEYREHRKLIRSIMNDAQNLEKDGKIYIQNTTNDKIAKQDPTYSNNKSFSLSLAEIENIKAKKYAKK